MTIPGARSSLRAMVLIACLLCCPSATVQGQDLSQETRLKAIHLKNVLNFVQWPAEANPANRKSFRFCVQGDHLLGIALAQELRTATIDDRRIEVRWAQKESDFKGCQVLYVGALEEKRVAKVLESVKGTSVLTLGAALGFLEAGGIVQLSYEYNTVRFGVNLTAARNAGLKLDARMLGLAQRVIRDSETPGG